MKCRVFKKNDGTVIYSWPSSKYQNNFEKAKFSESFNGLQFIDIDEIDLPPIHEVAGNSNVYFDGECKKENLKQDKEWSICLMPQHLIKIKHINRLNEKIDEVLDGAPADQLQSLKYQREKEKCKDWSEKEWHEQALKNLDEDGHEKPLIRQKLKDKIKELEEKK